MVSLKVVIGVPTFKRPLGLKRLLESIAIQQADFNPIVVVADNEGDDGQGLKLVEQINADGYPWEIHSIPVNDRGISQVRNALMNYAFVELCADNLAMVDDDEWVEPQWISELVKVQQQTGADVVGGTVFPEFELTPPDWVKGLGVYYRVESNVSGLVPLIQGTTNVMLNKKIQIKYPEERFDLFYSLVGGGDKEFFTRIKRRGGKFAFAHLATSHELFGVSRMTKKWAVERAFRIGAGDMRIILKSKPSVFMWGKEILKLLAAMLVSGFSALLTLGVVHKHMKEKLKFFRQLGKLSALFGKQKAVYFNVHGS